MKCTGLQRLTNENTRGLVVDKTKCVTYLLCIILGFVRMQNKIKENLRLKRTYLQRHKNHSKLTRRFANKTRNKRIALTGDRNNTQK